MTVRCVSPDNGSATVVILAVLAALVVAGLGVGVLAQGQLAAVTAQTAADAAALAAAPETFVGGSPGSVAKIYAHANGAELLSCTCPVDRSWEGRQASVTVRVPFDVWLLGEVAVTRSATAEFEPVALLNR